MFQFWAKLSEHSSSTGKRTSRSRLFLFGNVPICFDSLFYVVISLDLIVILRLELNEQKRQLAIIR